MGSQAGPVATNLAIQWQPKTPLSSGRGLPLPRRAAAPPPSPVCALSPARCICNEGKPSRHLHLPCRMRLLLALRSLAVDTHRPRRFLFRPALAGCAPGEIAHFWIRAMAR